MKTRFDFSEVIDRAKKSLNINTDKDFAERIGMKPVAFNARKKANSLPFEELLLMADLEKLDVNWLFYGDGIYKIPETNPIKTNDHSATYTALSKWDDYTLIPFYSNVEASAGNGSVVYDEFEVSHLAFKREWLRHKGLQRDKLSLIRVRGDSMEPTLYDGDILLVDNRIDRVIDDSIYIIQADHHLVVKRLQQAIDGSLLVISDNSRYERQKINSDQLTSLKIAGRVCWYGHEI